MKHFRKTAMILAGLCAALTVGCGTDSVQTTVQAEAPAAAVQLKESAPKGGVLSQQTAFSLNLFQHSLAAANGKNVLISPRSAVLALAMTANGACGETLAGMEQTFGGTPIAELNSFLSGQQNVQAEGAKFVTANSIWFRDGLDISDAFLKKNRDFYNSELFCEPFDKTTLDKINRWCETNTDGMIPKLFDSDELDRSTAMYLINAAAFDGKWARRYEAKDVKENQVFYAASGGQQTAAMMYSFENAYLTDEGASGFLRYYEGEKYAFAALLPDEGTSAEDYAASLTPARLQSLLAESEPCSVRAGIPVFSFDFSTDLKGALSAMGMASAFDGNADFSEMTESGQALSVSRVLHKTHISVDTEGTRAAALTAVEMRKSASLPQPDQKTVILNRPFVFMILDTETNLPLFIGILQNL